MPDPLTYVHVPGPVLQALVGAGALAGGHVEGAGPAGRGMGPGAARGQCRGQWIKNKPSAKNTQKKKYFTVRI